MKILLKTLFIIKLLLLLATRSLADVAGAIMDVSASIEPACTISASDMNFGPYNFVVSNEIATIAVYCTNGTQFRINLNEGNTPGASESNRMMRNGNDHLKYLLYRDQAMKQHFGSGNSNSLAEKGTGTLQYFKVYGQIPGSQQLPKGTYTDSVLISLIIEGVSSFGYQLSLRMNIITVIP